MSERFAESLSHHEHIEEEMTHMDPDIDMEDVTLGGRDKGVDRSSEEYVMSLHRQFEGWSNGDIVWGYGPSKLENKIRGIQDLINFKGVTFKLSGYHEAYRQPKPDPKMHILKKNELKLDEYVRRKQGVAEVATWLQSHALENSLNASEAYAYIETLSLQYSLPEDIRAGLHGGLDVYLERIRRVSEVMGKNYSAQVIYEKCFGFLPKGEVIVERYGGVILIRCMDQQDFALAYGRGEMKDVDQIWGVALISVGIPGLDHVVMLEKNIEGSNSAELIRHEHQHQINSLFNDLDEKLYPVSIEERRHHHLSQKRFVENPCQETLKDLIRSYVYKERCEIEKRAKDEIIAQYSGGTVALARTMKYHVNYQYNRQEFHAKSISRLPDFIQREISSVIHQIIEEEAPDAEQKKRRKVPLEIPIGYISSVIEGIFEDEYRKDIDNWVDVIRKMEVKGFGKDEIIGYLNTEALRRWQKMEKRLPSKSKES